MDADVKQKRVTKSSHERHRDLMEAAVRVFTEKGIGRATVADIAEAAGVAKGTFYLYFDTKEHLLGALRQQLVDETLERGMSFYERVGKDDWWALVDGMVASMIDLLFEHRDAILVFVQEGMTPETREVFAGCDQKLNEMLALGIKAGNDAGVFNVTDPYAMGALLHHAVEGVVLETILYQPDFEKERLVKAATELMHRALSG
jgi:AcrR family transcriptional regulator